MADGVAYVAYADKFVLVASIVRVLVDETILGDLELVSWFNMFCPAVRTPHIGIWRSAQLVEEA